MAVRILLDNIDLPDTDSTSYVGLLEDLNSRGLTLPENFNLTFSVFLEKNLTEGDMVYEFRPFRNIRYTGKAEIIPNTLPGELIDFSTTALKFDNNYPVEIEIQPSYDGSINLIINDDLNPPRMINSRFSITENNRFIIVDREGNKDTNIYDDDKLDNQTKLYKTINRIPKLDFVELISDGNFKVGNYVFYFRLVDADGNESDIITESGIVSCHVGNVNDPFSIRGGLANENSGKSIKFKFSNLDSNYNFLNVYFSKSSSSYEEIEITKYFKIDNSFSINSTNLDLKLTGYEPIIQITEEKINLQYNIIDSSKTQAQVQNRLFFANIHKATIPYRELKDLSLRILPVPYQDENKFDIGYLDENYKCGKDQKYEYYDAGNVYYRTGYWDKEIYRVAIVYIMNDYSLSNPFNLRGRDFSNLINLDATNPQSFYTHKRVYSESGEREYIEESDNSGIVGSTFLLENTKGTIRVGGEFLKAQMVCGMEDSPKTVPIGIKFYIPEDVEKELKQYTKGFFIVRQKRVPTILCQGLSIAHDKASGLPLIPELKEGSKVHTIQSIIKYPPSIYTLFSKGESYSSYVNEKIVTPLPEGSINNLSPGGILLSPDIILNSETLSSLFVGSEFKLSKTKFHPNANVFIRNYVSGGSSEEKDQSASHFVIKKYINRTNSSIIPNNKAKLIYVPENISLINNDEMHYSSRAGYAEEAWRFSAFLKDEDQLVDSGSLAQSNVFIRGIFTSFLGCSGDIYTSGDFYDIHILGYSPDSISDYFKLRYVDNSPFYSISDRYEWERFDSDMNVDNFLDSVNEYKTITCFRGDCFTNQITIRILRNFQDPETPINDKVVDPTTIGNFGGYKDANTGVYELIKDNLDKINRADVNAVRLGYWVTFRFCSNINYAFRCIDSSYTSEYSLFGRPRAFYPLSERSLAGSSKIADSNVMNVGYNSTTSDKRYYVIPDIPAIKNNFANRVMYSEIHINDAFKNGYRVFEGVNYQDFTNENGSITKIISWFGNIVVVFETGVGIIPVNERTLAGQSEGGSVFLRNAGVLPEKPMIISHGFGSTWIDSICQSQNYIYGVDTTAKKIWRTNGKTFEVISNFKIQKFLNDNLDVRIYDIHPLSGVRNVKTHFNSYKQDVIFTFYDEIENDSSRVWSMCYNEQLSNWVTRYTWIPSMSENIDNVYFSFNRDTVRITSKIARSIDSSSGLGTIYIESEKEKQLTLGDYLCLFNENKLDDELPTDNSAVVLGSNYNINVEIPAGNTYAFIDGTLPGDRHPMYISEPNFRDGISSGAMYWTFTTVTGNLLYAYDDITTDIIRLADNARINFYKSNGSQDILLDTKTNISKVGGLLTDKDYPIFKVELVVDPSSSLTSSGEADSLARDGWYFKIASITESQAQLIPTEYFLNLSGRKQYKNVDLSFSLTNTSAIYDNKLFSVYSSISPDIDYIAINPLALSSLSSSDKFSELMKLFTKTNLSLYINLDVYFKKDELGNVTADGTDNFKDVIYIRPSLQTLIDLRDMFFINPQTPNVIPITAPPLKPGVPLTLEQCSNLYAQLSNLISEYRSETSTYIWKHGQSGLFPHQDSFKPAYWYGKQHPFEFEFVVNGSELGIHKIFDNLKIISNRVQPESFEFEIVGDGYEFTKFDDKTVDLSLLDSLSGGQLLPNITLLNGKQTIYNKTNEYRILCTQEAKNIDNVGLRVGNIRYKEDMWEIQIKPIKYKKGNGPVKETKIRDKYCKIRVKYRGNQLAIITALQTLYTLSYA